MGESPVKIFDQCVNIGRMLRLLFHFLIAFPYRQRHFALAHILANHPVAGVNRLSHIRKDTLIIRLAPAKARCSEQENLFVPQFSQKF